ncbi:MAG: hypothetical protein AAF587_31785 [Bacteroidota bacterium]
MKFPAPIQALLQSLGWYGDQILLAVEIHTESEEFATIILEKTGEQIQILDSARNLSQAELEDELSKHAHLPIVVGIQQEGVVEAMISAEEKEVVKAVLGVAVGDKSHFVHQELPAIKGKKLASLVRRQQLEDWLVPLESVRDRIIFINISPGSLAFLLPGMHQYQPSKAYYWSEKWPGYLWRQGLEVLNGQEKNPIDGHEIAEGLQLTSQDLFLFGTAVQYHLSSGRPLSGWEESWENRERAVKRNRIIKALTICLPIMFSLIVGLALSNLLFQSHNQQSQLDLLANRSTLQTIRVQQEEINSQSQFLNRASQEVLAPTQVSHFLDQIAAVRSVGMSFRKIVISPSQKEWEKVTGEQGIQPPPLFVQGEALEAKAITVFAQSLQELVFTESALLYQTEFDFQEQVHTFTIIIHPAQ